jgi:plasmid stabilization system protein ParE
MTWRLVVRQRARLDLAEARDWYDERSPGRGEDFLRTLDEALRRIQENPLQYQLVRGALRRVLLRPYPYNVVYTVENNSEVIVLRCLHARRDPRHWPAG